MFQVPCFKPATWVSLQFCIYRYSFIILSHCIKYMQCRGPISSEKVILDWMKHFKLRMNITLIWHVYDPGSTVYLRHSIRRHSSAGQILRQKCYAGNDDHRRRRGPHSRWAPQIAHRVQSNQLQTQLPQGWLHHSGQILSWFWDNLEWLQMPSGCGQ